ncbi:hypothetical protein BS50DRAFT_585056 [Corynespora cassiicola Philippines]|uniref:ARM repeat-containing protein n=1 Tax=Corynespora cassiicola Philippines TaxID=1448308 RepID=A0A2T2P1N4_CORCC|nr:hypothetical protein BS50DRAFT_585056 [Corynespora cassiicola Philippines]
MADSQQAQAFPLAFEEIEQLVKTYYDPGHAKKITETEATLRVLQRSPQGWEIADALLNSNDENVRFFGALTFTIKLNADTADLSEEHSEQLLSKLIHHLVSRPASSVATRKLCSTLAQYFVKPIATWTHCIRGLVVSFGLQQPVPDSGLDEQPSTWDIVPRLADDQLLALLEFSMNLADEGKKLSTTPKYARYPLGAIRTDDSNSRNVHHRMIANVESMEVLLQVAFGRGIKYLTTPSGMNDPSYAENLQTGERICIASLKCFIGWIFYAQSEFKDIPEKLKYLRSVIELSFACLEYHVDDAMELVAEVLEGYPAFFEEKHLRMLWSAITGQWGLEILKNLDAETVSLSRIVVAYGQILLESKKLYLEPEDAHHQQAIAFLHDLLKYPDPVGVEDEVAPVVLDFWSTYVSTVAEELFVVEPGEQPPAWIEQAKTHVFLVVSELLQKMIYPPSEITREWDQDSRKTFKVFRVDVRDIILEAYESLRDAILDQFIDFSLRALEANNWLDLEGGMFCLVAVAEPLTEKSDERLHRLFERSLFRSMSGTTDVPAITRRTAVEMVAAYKSYFLRHTAALQEILPFLLSVLAQPSLAHGAAKSFASLCSECRKTLTGELAGFLTMYEQFLTYPTAEEFTKSKVLEGIAAIVQAQDSEEKQLEGVRILFNYVAQDAMRAISVTKEGNDPEQGQVLALTTLKCLSCIGRAMQAMDEEVIDLETDYKPSTFWTHGPGKEIQNQVINFVNYLTQVFPASGEIIEAACNVLRAGFKETVPGPFVLPPSAAVDYLTKATIETPRLPYVLETACCWIASNKHDKSEEFQLQAQRLLRHNLSIMQALQHPRNDPEIAVCCIDLIDDFVNVNPSIFTNEHPDILKGMFDFSIECIRSPEPLPKRHASKLWKNIFELAGNMRSKFQSTGQDITNHFGPTVAYALIANICGETDHSSLDHIIAPLRKLILCDKNARAYITNSLAQHPLIQRMGEDQATQSLIKRFIEGAIRNAKQTGAFKETVRVFWQNCKQLQMQLAPQMHAGHRFAHGMPAGNGF